MRKNSMSETQQTMLFNEINILSRIVSQPAVLVPYLLSNKVKFICVFRRKGPPEYRQDVRVLRGRQTLFHSHGVSEDWIH